MTRSVTEENSVDYQRMLDTSTAFFLAGERCAPTLEFGEYGPHRVDAPRIVCYALAVEIVLKLLARHRGTFSEGHSLRKLYRNLPPDLQEALSYLEDHLDEMDRYFVDWRYPYEKDFLIGSTNNVRRVFILCYQEIRRQLPELRSIYERNWGKFEPDSQWAWYEHERRELEWTPT